MDTIKLIMDSWCPSTKRLYTTYLKKWAAFCCEHNIELLKPSLPQVCRFLRVLSGRGLGYGALDVARSALAAILPAFDGFEVGKHPLVCRIIKGAYERNPPRSRYSCFWDVNKVFSLLKRWGDTKDLSLKRLSWKLSVLLLLVTSQRGQTIVNLDIENLDISTEAIVFRMKTLLKHNRLGDPLDSLTSVKTL